MASADSGSSQRTVVLRFPVPHDGLTFEDLRPCRGDEHHGRPHVGDQPLEEIEQIRLCPVDVLDDEDDRGAGRELLDKGHGGRMKPLARVEGMKLGCDVESEREPEDLAALETRGDLGSRNTFPECEVLAHHFAERPVRDARAVREAAARATRWSGLLRRESLPELADESRLPDARLADDRHEVRVGLRSGAPVCRAQELELRIASDENASKAAHAPWPHRPQRTLDAIRHHAARLALRLDGARSREGECARSGRDCPLACKHLAGLGRLLQPIGDVHGVTRDERASRTGCADDDIARIHSDAKLERAGKQLAHPLLHRERRMQRALGVVLERRGGAEHGHHRIAGELLDGAAGELDLGSHRVVELFELYPHAFRIAITGERGRPDKIGEQDRDELALFPGTHEAESCRAAERALPEDGRERLFPRPETVVELRVRGRQRTEHANAVSVDSGLEEQQPTLQCLADHGLDELRCRFLRGGVSNELDRQHRAHPANVPDQGPARLPVEHARTNRSAEELRALDELFLLEDVEHGARGRERDGIANERPADRARVRAVHDLRPADHT